MYAVISDIHSNLEALTAVFNDVDARGIQSVVCLGDIVGYGPSPRECLDLIIERCEVCLCGNHDHAVLYEPYNFNVGAERRPTGPGRCSRTNPIRCCGIVGGSSRQALDSARCSTKNSRACSPRRR